MYQAEKLRRRAFRGNTENKDVKGSGRLPQKVTTRLLERSFALPGSLFAVFRLFAIFRFNEIFVLLSRDDVREFCQLSQSFANRRVDNHPGLMTIWHVELARKLGRQSKQSLPD